MLSEPGPLLLKDGEAQTQVLLWTVMWLNFGGTSGVGEVSVPFPLMNRVKSHLPRSFATPPRGVVGCPIDWAGSLTKAGRGGILSQRNAQESVIVNLGCKL